jgi:hypothetical protein
MKKIILILSAIVLLAACSKKQDTVKPPLLTPKSATAKDLTGKWDLAVDTTFTTTNGQTTTSVNTNTAGISFQFNADGTGAQTISNANLPFTYKVSDGLILMHTPASQNTAAEDLTFTITVITTTKLAFRSLTTDETTALAFIKD